MKELPSTLWAIRTTVHSGIRDTPFNLTFDADVVIPVEIEINNLRVKYFDFDQNKDNIRTNLDLLEKVKDEANV